MTIFDESSRSAPHKGHQEEKEAFVWIWLPNETEPVIAGRLQADNGNLRFNYGSSYLERVKDGQATMSIYEPELPLQPGVLPLPDGLALPGCIRDAAPDSWGRRVILNKLFGRKGANADATELGELTYLLESGSDRIGALDFQRSPTEYQPRSANNASVDDLMESAERVEKGIPLTNELDLALLHGSSIGGARPKALIDEQDAKHVAKFSSGTDLYGVIKAEFVAMRLAAKAGLDVAPVKLVKAAKREVLLIERFDRVRVSGAAASPSAAGHAAGQGAGWSRRAMVSALTILGLGEMMGRYASYEGLAEIIRCHFTQPQETLRELFARMAFNVLCGNTDDHARNHAAFWDGKALTLTPAYDICPQGRTGNEASQAMLIHGDDNSSRLTTCLASACDFMLSEDEARDICAGLIAVIEEHFNAVCDEAELSEVDRNLLWGRQFLNPFAVEGW